MARSKSGAVRAYEIADAKSCLKATNKHWPLVHARGATEPERKLFEATISQAEKMERPGSTLAESVTAAETARHDFKQSLGEFRAVSLVVANGIDGLDAAAESALKVQGAFPATDTALRAFMRGLVKPLKTYSAKLAQRGFDKEQQAHLLTAFAAFESALNTRTSARGEQAQQRHARETLFSTLAKQTRYFRELGRLALRSKSARADFDRVKLHPGKRAAKKPVPAPAPSPSGKKAVAQEVEARAAATGT